MSAPGPPPGPPPPGPPPPGSPPPPPGPGGKSNEGILLIATLLDMTLFGLVAQQYYTYWMSGFKDAIYLKLFVNVQFALVALQSIMIGHLAGEIYVQFQGQPPPSASLWSGPANSLCQLFIIILANGFLSFRIHGLTKSRIQSLVPFAFSTLAFVFGMVTVVSTAYVNRSQSFRHATSVIWYISQATAECLISFFLARALLKARSGVQRSDMMVRYLARNVIQTGVLAAIWALSALVAWFFVQEILVYRVFDITSGTVYTHAIFETLISRTLLRDRMATSSAIVDLGHSQSQSSQRTVHFPSITPLTNTDSEPGSLTNKNEILELDKMPPQRPDRPYEF